MFDLQSLGVEHPLRYGVLTNLKCRIRKICFCSLFNTPNETTLSTLADLGKLELMGKCPCL